jgi:hypothetical protein
MRASKQEAPAIPGQAVSAAPAKKAEKVRSSRFEWESKAGDHETPAPQSKSARNSLLTLLATWLKKLFSIDRNFFDKDDDATPSAA